MTTCYIIYIIIIIIIITESNDNCANQLVTCKTEIGDIGSRSVSCSNLNGYRLVSCGIRNDFPEDFATLGTSINSDICTIYYNHTFANDTIVNDLISNETKPRAYARCCNFRECFNKNFECKLETETSRSNLNQRCSIFDGFPHLMSCSLRQRSSRAINEIIDDSFGGFYFSSSGGLINENTFRNDFFSLFNLTTNNPTISPTKSPTIIPSISSIISSPTTLSPTNNPTLLNNITVGQRLFGGINNRFVYLQDSDLINQCSLQRFKFDKRNFDPFITIETLCCTEKNVTNSITTTTTSAPTTNEPSIAPTIPTKSPTADLFADGGFISVETNVFPLNTGSIREEFQFTDTDRGTVLNLEWGVSNINRSFKHDKNGGIQSIQDIELNKYYFTIKKYRSLGGLFESEYGRIYLKDNDTKAICPPIPLSKDKDDGTIIESNTIQKIHIYINEINNTIDGMTMWRFNSDSTTDIFTCHIKMAQANKSRTVFDNSFGYFGYNQTFIDNLIETDMKLFPNHTINFRNCPADLSGFIGEADGFGIDKIQFQFVFEEKRQGTQNCSQTQQITPSPTNAELPTLPPTITNPTSSPTISNISSSIIDQNEINGRTLQCYYIMDKQNASCLNLTSSTSSTTINNIIINHDSFMISCNGYSLFDQPISWFIENDTCFVGSGRDELQIAAIATCCTLIDKVIITIDTSLTTTQILTIIAIVIGSIIVLAIWIGFIVFCVYTQRRNKQQEEKNKRLNNVKKETRNGEQELILSDEQKDDRLDLKPFQVNEDEFNEMLELQKRGSTEQIGLEAF